MHSEVLWHAPAFEMYVQFHCGKLIMYLKCVKGVKRRFTRSGKGMFQRSHRGAALATLLTVLCRSPGTTCRAFEARPRPK